MTDVTNDPSLVDTSAVTEKAKEIESSIVDQLIARVTQLENMILLLLKVAPIENGDAHAANIATASKTAE